MWTTLALAAALSLIPAQGGLTVGNDHLALGYFGPPRKDANYLPGDVIYLAFDANNVKTNAAGKASCGVTLELFDGAGKSIFRQAPRMQQAACSLGGNSLRS